MSWPPVSLGDLFRAIRELQPDCQAIEAIRLALKLSPPTLPDTIKLPRDLMAEAAPGPIEPASREPEKPAETAKPEEPPVPMGLEGTAAVRFTVIRVSPGAAPAGEATPGDPLPWVDERAVPPMPLIPLIPRSKSRAILTTALSQRSRTQTIDLAVAVEHIAAGRELRVLPLRWRRSLARGVDVLVDTSTSMDPYAADQTELIAELRRVVGRERTTVFRFDACPSFGIISESGQESEAYAPSAPGRAVLVLSDFGIGAQRGRYRVADPADWLDFVSRVREHRSPLIALIPHRSTRWPRALRSLLAALTWDEELTVSAVRQARNLVKSPAN